MSSIPLPALSVHAPEQPDIMGQVGNLMRLKQLAGQQQVQQQQIVAGQQENQVRAQSIKDQQAMTSAMQSWDGKDGQQLIQGVIKAGGSANAVMGLQQKVLAQKETLSKIAEQDATTGSKNIETQKAKADAVLGVINGLKQLPDEELPGAVAQKVQEMQQQGLIDPKAMGQIQQLAQGDAASIRQHLDTFGKINSFQSQQLEAVLKQSEVSKNNAEASAAGGVEMKQMNDWLAKNPGKGPADYQTFKLSQARESEIQKEIDPRVMAAKERVAAADAKMQQAIKDGSAEDAGKLMAQKLVAPSEVQARSNPSFFVKAAQAAVKYDPAFNPQRAEAEFAVAKSPTNVGFFGSAKSLTDKGGTLDQLEKVGQQIPQHDLPVLNTIDDWKKAATGSGPIAHYASTALGVADDYAKVMGGGQGSDTSREQALKLIAPTQSPDQRAQAITGIRDAVGSQQESRIGNNGVLKAMYGNQPSAQPGPAQQAAPPQNGKFSVTDPTGVVHYFKSQAQADGFKRDAGIN